MKFEVHVDVKRSDCGSLVYKFWQRIQDKAAQEYRLLYGIQVPNLLGISDDGILIICVFSFASSHLHQLLLVLLLFIELLDS